VTQTHTILVAEKNSAARAFLADNLTADGYEVLAAEDRPKAIALLDVRHPDLVVVDVNGETLALLDAVRSAEGLASRVDPDTPMIVLTGRADALHRVRVLDRGGDDVLAKPFSYPELRARIGAVLRRAECRRNARILRAGPIAIEVRFGERRVELTAKEYDLLVALAGEPTRVFTREELLRAVWGHQTFGRTRTLDSHAARLRGRLVGETDDKFVVNVWGVGYRLMDGQLQ
jgi:DNA-binding response OmpR family regulator